MYVAGALLVTSTDYTTGVLNGVGSRRPQSPHSDAP